jgi:hypothetical protein
MIYGMWLQKMVGQKLFSPPLLVLLLDPGSGMDKIQDPGSGMNIRDPQHCSLVRPQTLHFTGTPWRSYFKFYRNLSGM